MTDVLLVDDAVPTFDVTIVEHTLVDAPVPVAWRALCDLDLLHVHSPLLDAAFWVRGVPYKVKHTPAPAPASLRLGADGDAPMEGWVSLGRTEEHEIALGAVGRFWQPVIEWRTVAPTEFGAFAEPGWGKIGVSFSMRPYGRARALLTYECRVATFDDDARRSFARYWRLIRPFVGHVMRATLAQAKHDAEALPAAA